MNQKITRRKLITRGGIGIGLLAIAGTAWSLVSARIEENMLPEIKASDRTTSENLRIIEKAAIDYYIEFFGGGAGFRGYVDRMVELKMPLNPVKKNIDFHRKKILEEQPEIGARSLEELARARVVLAYTDFHKIPIEYAVHFPSGELPHSEIEKMGLEMRTHQSRAGKQLFVDYNHPDVVKSYMAFGLDRVNFYQRVIAANIKNPNGDFKVEVRKAFTKEEFRQSLVNYEEIRKQFYDSLAQSLRDYKNESSLILQSGVRAVGPIVVNLTTGESDRINMEELNRIFPGK